jgi:signal transduction histidine kinase
MNTSEYQTVWGNVAALEQILTNVIKNAIHYTPSGGTVSISVDPDYRGNIVISVADTGMGIPEKDLMHIFEPFYRGDSSRNRESGAGSGLGLAIVSELVKLHKGRIAVESIVGKGTRVEITLPHGHTEEAKDIRGGGISIDFSKGRGKKRSFI